MGLSEREEARMRASRINLLRGKRKDWKPALALLLRSCLTKIFFIAFPGFDTEKRQRFVMEKIWVDLTWKRERFVMKDRNM